MPSVDPADDLVEKACAYVTSHAKAMESLLRSMVETSSWTRDVHGVNAVGTLLRESVPLECEVVSGGAHGDHCVFHAGRPASDGGVILLGHMDTVFPRETFAGYRSDGERAYGPGVLDMKGGLVVVVFALRALERVGALRNMALSFVAVSDEEVGSPDSTPTVRRVARGAKVSLDFESGRPGDALVTRRKGTGSFTVTARGRAAHAGNHHATGANAIWALARYIDGAQRLTDYAEEVTVNIGTVRGGIGKNTVPAEAVAEGDLRYVNAAQRDAIGEGLVGLCASSAVEGTRLEFQWGPGRPPLERTEASGALRDQYEACQRAVGLGGGELAIVGGGSDAATTGAMGIPSIDGLGPRGDGYHTVNEYIELPTLALKCLALVRYLAAHHATT